MSKPKIFIAGHNGMVGSVLVRLFKKKKVEIIKKEKKELNLLDQKKFKIFLKIIKLTKFTLQLLGKVELMLIIYILLNLFMKI